MTSGRLPLYDDPAKFKEVADAFFAECQELEEIPTVNGLCMALDMTRETLLRYEEKELFSDTVKKVRQRLERAWEKRLGEAACTGAIFWLKNQGWRDKVETEHTGPNGSSLFAGAEIVLVRATPEG